jgi:uncharacterized protein
MQFLDGELVVSPTDLTKSLACSHLTRLDLEVAGGTRERPPKPDEALETLFKRGREHEDDYRQSLIAQGFEVVEVLVEGSGRAALVAAEAATVVLMRRGVDVIYQATFFDEQWRGHADFLLRRDDRPGTWPWSYDVADTKLARRLKVPALLQMAAYAERLTELQGVEPENLIVVTGDRKQHAYAFAQCAAYARRVRQQLLAQIADVRQTRPEPVSHCARCSWEPQCRGQWRKEDHLSLVAFMRRDHQTALEEVGITTVRALGATSWRTLPATIGDSSRRRLAQQARLQIKERDGDTPVYELLPAEAGRGLALLPEPSAGDVFFDIEGDPFVGQDGLEYLWGTVTRGVFQAFWALGSEDEKATFEALVDHLMDAWAADPDMHIYHYAPYEPSRLTKLAARYGTRQSEIDQLLRGERLVDLYAVVRQGIRVSKESYSLKKLESFYWRDRGDGVNDALGSIVAFERWLVEQDASLLEDIRAYSEDDCRSTAALRGWLEGLRAEGGGDSAFARPEHGDGVPSEGVLAERTEIGHLIEALRVGVPVDPDARDAAGARRWLMSDLLEWHRREALPEWWNYFRRLESTDEELVLDTAALGLLSAFELHETGKTSNIWRATFSPQETKIGPGETRCVDPRTGKVVGTVVSISPEDGEILVRRARKMPAPEAPSLVPGKPLDDGIHRARLRDLARHLLTEPTEDVRDFRVSRDLLGRAGPRVSRPLRPGGEGVADCVARNASELDAGLLPVQGPPGTGKTYAGARMIVRLLSEGKRVGIVGPSHRVIGNLLDEVCAAADRAGVEVRGLQKANPEQRCGTAAIEATQDAKDVEERLACGDVHLVAGTAWLFARPGMQQRLDVLVADEAGQLSLANVLAVAGSAASLVLLGDPRQLAQPVKGLHPQGTGVSALEHILRGAATLGDEQGILLDTTFRMHPSIAAFISETSYDGRLLVRPECAGQEVLGGGVLGGSGLRFVPVAHRHNSAASTEEAEVVARLVTELLTGGSWRDADGVVRRLVAADVLILTPYNAQVHRLRQRLTDAGHPDVRVGTVDKLQGQEAAVVVYSTASSSVDDAPRGTEFLYSLNRFNVAVSRARAVMAVVASPTLLAPHVDRPDQLRLVNALCRFVELCTPAESAFGTKSPSRAYPESLACG